MIQLFSTCPHPPLQCGTSHDCHMPGAKSCRRSPSSKGVKWCAAEWCHAGGPGQQGSMESLHDWGNPMAMVETTSINLGSRFLAVPMKGHTHSFSAVSGSKCIQAHLHLRAVETERLGTILLLSTEPLEQCR